MIGLWRGFHSKEISHLLESAWNSENLLILCPGSLRDFSFIPLLPPGEIKFLGDWDATSVDLANVALSLPRENVLYSKRVILGAFTTGTTSPFPRLVLYSKENIECSLESIRSLFEIEKIKSVFVYPQPTHAFGLILGYVHSMLYKLKLIQPDGRYSKTFHHEWNLKAEQTTLTLGTPTHFEDLISQNTLNRITPPATYSCIVGGAPVSVTLWKRLKSDLRVLAPSIGYGASEATLGVTHLPPGMEPSRDSQVGYAFSHIELSLEKENGLRIKGPTVCAAMIQNGKIEFPTEIFLRDDLEIGDQGYIYRGRMELVINRGGSKISLEHLEGILQKHIQSPLVCVPVFDSRLGEELGVVATETSLTGPEIFKILKAELDFSFNENNFIKVDKLPVNANLKIDRARCQNLFTNHV